MSNPIEIAGNEQSIGGIPITPESVARLPDAPGTDEDAIGIGELSAHVAVLSKKKPGKIENAPPELVERVKP